MKLPENCTEADIEQALTETLKKPIKIKEIQVRPNEAGGNYCSDIYRIKVVFSEANKADKTQVVHLLLKNLFESMTDNSREHFMYETVLPEMNAILGEQQRGARLSPKVYRALRQSGEQHLFDDLNEQGYIMCDRLVGYTTAEAMMILKKLGQFHGISMVYKEKYPEKVASMKEFFAKSQPSFMTFVLKLMHDNTQHAADIVEKWPQFAEIAQKMRANTGDNFKRKFLNTLEKEDCQVLVIAHGDLWIKNILVLENAESGPCDAIFLDYQNCFDGSPGLDINNFLMTSVQLDAMNSDAKREELIEHYYGSLQLTLLGAGYAREKIPTLAQIMHEIRRTEYFAYYCLIFAFTQTNLSEELAKDMDFASFSDEERLARNRLDMFSNKRVLATYEYMLKRFNDLGLLD